MPSPAGEDASPVKNPSCAEWIERAPYDAAFAAAAENPEPRQHRDRI